MLISLMISQNEKGVSPEVVKNGGGEKHLFNCELLGFRIDKIRLRQSEFCLLPSTGVVITSIEPRC